MLACCLLYVTICCSACLLSMYCLLPVVRYWLLVCAGALDGVLLFVVVAVCRRVCVVRICSWLLFVCCLLCVAVYCCFSCCLDCVCLCAVVCCCLLCVVVSC